eukprot:s2366_g7.t1
MADVAPVADNHGCAFSSLMPLGWSIFIQKAPENSCDVLVRPEVQAMFEGDSEITLQCLETYAPGDALIERTNSMWILRFAAEAWQGWCMDALCCNSRAKVLFGSCHDSFAYRFYHKLPVLSQHRLYKDFPEPGDCTYLALEGIWTMRRVPGSARHYRSVFVISTPEDKWATWASPFYPAFTHMFHKVADRVLNGGTIRDLRAADASMYVVLTLNSFNRGHPMVPQSKPSEDSVTVAAGKYLGLVSWTRFKPHEKFHLSDYLRDFMERLGHQLKTYGVMDGRKLVRYQCVVVRQQWDQLRTPFFEAFQVQKAAYRRANGGTAAPTLAEDAAPRFLFHDFSCAQPEGIKTIVRKTFIELDEDSNDSADCLKRSNSAGEVVAY